MRRISVIMLTIASVLTMLACVSNQTPTTGAPKVGKPLVKRLPAKIEGVELVGGTVRAKSGYKFVKQPNGTVTVARMAGGGGLGLGGTWNCDCGAAGGGASTGTCTAMIQGNLILCLNGTCTGSCTLTIETTGLRQGVIIY